MTEEQALTPSPSPNSGGGEPIDDTTPAFPAPEQTPGQAESRTAHRIFWERRAECPWWDDYIALRQAGWTWRVAAYIAWASSPAKGRWPDSQEQLAIDVLGLQSDRSIRNWRKKFPTIDEEIAQLQIAPLMKHRRDVIDALIEVASSPEAGAHQDRKLFLQMTGDAPVTRAEISVSRPEDEEPYVVDGDTAESIFDILEGAGAIEPAPGDAPDDEVHTPQTDAQANGVPDPAAD